jgi:hypothetical protein
MTNEKQYRKLMGFKSAKKFLDYLKTSDIVLPNFDLIHQRNERLIKVFTYVNQLIKYREDIDIRKLVNDTTQTVIDNHLLHKMKNHGRAIEDVYYSWLSGYVAEHVFKEYIKRELNLTELERFGKDDLSDPQLFKRSHDADLVSHKEKVYVDVQSGYTGTRYDIKKGKVDKALSYEDYDSYIFFVDISSGTYAIQNLKELKNATFVPNAQWEGQLCFSVPESHFYDFWGSKLVNTN